LSTTGPPGAVREPFDEPLDPGLPDPTAGLDPTAGAFPTTGAVATTLPARRWGFGAYLFAEAVFLTASLLLVLPYVGAGHRGSPPPLVLLLSLTVPTILSAGAAILVTRLRGNGPRADLGLRMTRADLSRGFGYGCAGLMATIPAAALWSHVVGVDEANSAVARLFAGQRFSVPLAASVFLVVWLVAPVCEEIVYRGLLWGAMERNGANRWWAFGVTTLAFALAHFELTRTPLLLVIAVPIGLARVYSDNIAASIVAHQVNNLIPAVSLFMLMIGAHPW
jgi:hypothetical protein